MLEVRTATLADVAAVVRVVESAYRGPTSRLGWTTEADLLDGQRTDGDEVSAIVLDAASRLLVLAEGLEMRGTVMVRSLPPRAHIGMLAVQPGHQSRGLGRLLLEAAEGVARSEFGAAHAVLSAISLRTELLEWYGRHGYVDTGVRERFPYGEPRFGLPRRPDLEFAVLAKPLG